MKIKAVILRPDRTNDVVILKQKKLEGNRFRHANASYEVDEENFRLTWGRSWRSGGKTEYYSTYYYKQGVSKPLPMAELHELQEVRDISGEELAAIFNPWFYRIIAQGGVDKWAQIQFYIIVGLGLAVLYLLYVTHGMSGDINALHEALLGGQPTTPRGGGTIDPNGGA